MLKEMLPSVDSLEESRDKLVIPLKGERNRCGGDVRVLEEVCKGVEKSCGILARAFTGLERRLL
jgi:hypothetical protein